MDKLRVALQSIISHWDEFGPEHGLYDLIHLIRPMLALTDEAPAQSHDPELPLDLKHAHFYALAWAPVNDDRTGNLARAFLHYEALSAALNPEKEEKRCANK